MSDPNPLIGKKVVAVQLADDKKAIRFEVEGGEPIVAKADGDCCSSTWIEGLDAPDALLGTVQSVEGIPMPDLGTPPDCECVAFYGCKITTEKGACVIDYRNESNGYYGGSLCWPNEYYYGGVYNQNASKEDWKPLVGTPPARP